MGASTDDTEVPSRPSEPPTLEAPGATPGRFAFSDPYTRIATVTLSALVDRSSLRP
jgi:hypothetical protein